MRAPASVLVVIAIVGLAASLLVGRSRAGDLARMRAELALDVERGGITDLGRAEALGRRLVLAAPSDREAAAGLAFTSGVLAVDYGLDTAREAEAALARGGAALDGADEVASEAAAARALVLARAGDARAAERVAAAAAASAPGAPFPLYALGRARTLGGDLPAAARALQAATVGAPGFLMARVAWAEVRLDLGDAKTASVTLEELLRRAPDDLRAWLLREETEQALGAGTAPTLARACPEGDWRPRAVVAGCALARAVRSRRAGARAEALAGAEAAARLAPDEPRLLARIAVALAQLGAVDRASNLLERAARLAAPRTPALAWAAAAIALGRGRAPPLPPGPRPADPEARLLVARAALAAGGLGALAATLDELGEGALAADADLRLLGRLARRRSGPRAQPAGDDPLAAYADGLRLRLDGDLPAAAGRLGHALGGHGDACRAAGEYIATLRALGQHAEPAALAALRAENAGCVNLNVDAGAAPRPRKKRL
jgi:tetratricopeptide (TPR) repeat protein